MQYNTMNGYIQNPEIVCRLNMCPGDGNGLGHPRDECRIKRQVAGPRPWFPNVTRTYPAGP